MNTKKAGFELKSLTRQMITCFEKRMENKFFKATFFAVILIVAFMVSPAISSMTANLTIRATGRVRFISPLHVDGRYIKDETGHTVLLRGVNKNGFEDGPAGIWMGSLTWNPSHVQTELDTMESWGCNVLRLVTCVEYWKLDTENHRQHIKDILLWAGQRGIYVIYSPRQVKPYPEGTQDALPYPPYQGHTSTHPNSDFADTIASEEEYIQYYLSVLNELKDYPNVIFEFWNEPGMGGSSEMRSSWWSTIQDLIYDIRGTGDDHLLLFQWEGDIWIDLARPSAPWGHELDWVEDYPLNDPTGNLVYSTHAYRSAGGFGYWSGEEYSRAYLYDDILDAFQKALVDYVGETLNKPLLIGEVGVVNMATTGEEFEHEIEAGTNALSIFNDWELGYIAWWWRPSGVWRIYIDRDTFSPNEAGQILIDAIATG